MTDAIATIRQVSKLRPQWFCRQSNTRSRNAPTRFGISDNSLICSVTHKAFEKLDFPTEISHEISGSSALVGDIWRLAVRKIISDFET